MAETLDPEMLENLDLLLNLDEVESESDWTEIENMENETLGGQDSDSSATIPNTKEPQ